MACVMNPAFWVYIIFLVAAIMIVRLVLPAAASFFGAGPLVMQILMIILWAIILAAGVYLIFELFSCIFSSGFPSLPGRRSDFGIPFHAAYSTSYLQSLLVG